jgi:tRNA (guanine37-N1)-methyltransferase
MRITILTLFPEMYQDFLKTSIVGRAIGRGLVSVDLVQIRDFAHDTYRHVDDTPFGGGAGMVMKCQPVLDALDSVRTPASYSVLLSASGRSYTQAKAHELSGREHLILLCGHYEGVDERIAERMDESLSIGDYVLTGGELGSMVIADSVIRLLKGSIKADSTQEESYENGLLEYPQYSQPADYHGAKVPAVLLSGDHEKIRRWRLQQSLKKTRQLRPDLFAKHELNKEEQKLLRQLDEEEDPQE